jgi:hypothetical protein
MNKLRILALALVALTASISDGLAPRSAEAATGVCEAEILAAARAYGVPPGILHSVGLTETGRKGSLHPYALNIEGRRCSPAAAARHCVSSNGPGPKASA